MTKSAEISAIHAPQSGKIAEVFVPAGAQVDAKDLLATYAGRAGGSDLGETGQL